MQKGELCLKQVPRFEIINRVNGFFNPVSVNETFFPLKRVHHVIILYELYGIAVNEVVLSNQDTVVDSSGVTDLEIIHRHCLAGCVVAMRQTSLMICILCFITRKCSTKGTGTVNYWSENGISFDYNYSIWSTHYV